MTSASTAAPTPAEAPAAVRETVTVPFAELSGSAGFGERNDAEISRQVLALAPVAPPAQPENELTRRLAVGFARRSDGGVNLRPSDLAEGVTIVDRRTGVSAGPITGRDEFAANAAALFDTFSDVRSSVVAVRGERLALMRVDFTADGFVSARLNVWQMNESGEIDAAVVFDDTDLFAALTEMDERYVATGTVPPVEVGLLAGLDALNRQDWDRFTASLHPELVAVDHSPLGFPTTDRAGFVEDQMQTMAALVPDFVVVASEVRSRGRATFARGTTLGTTAEGSEYSWHFFQVILTAADGRGLRRDLFAETQWPEALACFEHFAAENTAPLLENRATAAGRRAREAALRGDRDAVLDAFAPDFTRTEHRPRAISGDRVVGRELYVDGMLAGPDAGLTEFDATTLEIVGDDLGLGQVRWHNGEGFAQEWVLVYESGTDGRLRRIANFEPEDRAAASALMHEWAADTHASPG